MLNMQIDLFFIYFSSYINVKLSTQYFLKVPIQNGIYIGPIAVPRPEGPIKVQSFIYSAIRPDYCVSSDFLCDFFR